MKWMIVADSSCDLKTLENESSDLRYETVPFQMILDGQEYEDNEELNVQDMVDRMEIAKSSHSACPAPNSWVEKFMEAEHSIAITISSRLSGSYNSAMAARGMVLEQDPDKKIEVIDSLSTGPKLVLLAQLAARKIEEKASFEEVCTACKEFARTGKTVFTLSSFHNLVQNGRVSKVAGFIAGKLGIRVIGIGTDEGRIHLKELMRGEKKILRNLIACMREDGYQGQPMAISHCLNLPLAEELKTLIMDTWHGAIVQILPTRGLDSYYAERSGLIVSYPV